ncbi:MAG: LysR substrate-binding domain-containing protein, partial [Gammaproteobacteria bacterium]|nr:LysR substrate-binding domain-containing protein [Gammaproteobacteria bacterium]
RTRRGYAMTEAGELVMHRANSMDELAINLKRELMGRDIRLQGTIRVTSPEGIAYQLLTPAIKTFGDQHPEIQVELLVTNSELELSRHEADLAVRVTNEPPDMSLARRVSKFRFCSYASPEYLRENNHSEMFSHRWIAISDELNWIVPKNWGSWKKISEQVVFSSSQTLIATHSARLGMGVVILPCFLGDTDPGLVRVGEPLENPVPDLWVLTHPDLRNTARVRALLIHLYEFLLEKKELLEGGCTGEH